MVLPLMILGFGAIFSFISRDLIIGFGSLYFNSVHTNFNNFCLIDSEFLTTIIKNIPFIFTILGAFLSLLLINCYNINKEYIYELKLQNRNFYIFLNKKWHFDQIVNEWLVVKIMNFGYLSTFLSIDKGLIEKLGPTDLLCQLSIFQLICYKISSGFIANNTCYLLIQFVLFFFVLCVLILHFL